jgi:hypothetical protein
MKIDRRLQSRGVDWIREMRERLKSKNRREKARPNYKRMALVAITKIVPGDLVWRNRESYRVVSVSQSLQPSPRSNRKINIVTLSLRHRGTNEITTLEGDYSRKIWRMP